MAAPTAETVYLHERGLIVGSGQIVCPDGVYLTRQVTAVRLGKGGASIRPITFFCGSLLIFACMMIAAAGFRPILSVAVVFAVGTAYICWRAKPTHIVYITTSGGEAQAAVSPDEAFARQVAEAIRRAVAS